jgi:DNA processing protein
VSHAAGADAAPVVLAERSPAGPSDVILRRDDARYPANLCVLAKPPAVLYARGDLAVLDGPCVAIVGSRRPTPYGITVAYEAAREAARAGLVVVSGMARGLDARAHRGALDGGGRTVAVLGCGFDVPYPVENLDLLEAVPRNGLLLSEFAPGTRPTKWSFPARNRIIVALAKVLLVVEGKAQGGTSNTVKWMNEVGRSVLAVPGRIDEPVAEGPNRLIQDGAWPYLTPQDLLVRFGLQWDGAPRPDGTSPRASRPAPPEPDVLAALSGLAHAEALVFDVVTPDPVHVDAIGERAGLDHATLLAALSSLEIKGLVAQVPGKRFRLLS